MWSISIVDDAGFHCLMEMGQPHYCIPSSRTVANNIHVVFCKAKDCIAKMLKVSFSFILVKLQTHSEQRTMTVIWISPQMLGPHQITNLSWRSQSISSITVSQPVFCWILSSLRNHIQAWTWLEHLPKYLRTLAFPIRWAFSIYWIYLDQETNVYLLDVSCNTW